MRFDKTEWYIFGFAALTMALIYNVAARNLLNGGLATFQGAFNTIMGRTGNGTFQRPF